MSRGSWILIVAVGAVLALAASAAHVARRYQEALEGRRQLELQLGEVRAAQQELEYRLTEERQRSSELTKALGEARVQLEQAAGRLVEESRSVRELQVRLAAMQRQMDQLQGELSLTLEQVPSGTPTSTGKRPVALERIVVSNAQADGLRGRILSIHADWNFVIIDIGWSAVRIGDTVSIFRNDQLLARARIERVQEGVCAATVLPQWEIADIRVNDSVQVL